MKIRVKRNNIFNILMYAVFLFTYLVSLVLFKMGEDGARYRYFALATALIVSCVYIILRYGVLFFKKKLYGKELFYVLITCIVFWIMSVRQSDKAGYALNFRTYVQIALILMPAVYAFCIINLFSMNSIINIMKFTLISLVVIYFCEPGHRILNFFIIENWKAVSFFHSNSFTESSLCAEAFFQLFLFFNYYKNKMSDNKKDRSLIVCYYAALIFTVLSFKRLAVVFLLCILIMSRIVDLRGEISPKFVWFFSLFFTIATYFYTRFMQGLLFKNVDVFKFTTGRDYILSLWAKKNYLSYGYGSSMLQIGRYLEMDLVQIYLELNLVALFVFCFGYFKIARKNIYSFMIMTYVFLNMLTASSIPYSLGWIILLVTITSISSDKYKNENVIICIKKKKFKRVFSIS